MIKTTGFWKQLIYTEIDSIWSIWLIILYKQPISGSKNVAKLNW